VAAVEILICAGAVRDLIREPTRTAELRDYIRDAHEQFGTQTFDQHLMELVVGEAVTYETALLAATNPKDFELQMRTVRRRSRAAAPTDVARAPAADGPAGLTGDLSRLFPSQ
jgi:twitching motility protein PilT